MGKTSIIRICKNIKFDRDNLNVLTYSESDLLTLCTTYTVKTSSTYSFIGGHDSNIISVEFPYSDCLSCNYLAFQNYNYNNKWYFAFIDKVEYVSDKVTKIHFTVDVFHTWWSYWTPKQCFVVREHVSDDTVGLHTIPEGLDTGEFISTKLQPSETSVYTTCYCVGVTELITPFTTYSTLDEPVPSGVYYLGAKTVQGVYDIISLYQNAGKEDAITAVFVIPDAFFSSWTTLTGISGQVSTNVKFKTNLTNVTVSKVTYLANDYTPVNKKLLCYPYSFLQVSNHNGTIVNYRWEEFNKLPIENPASTDIRFVLKGAFCIGGSFMLTPLNYRNILNNNDDGIVLGKYPVGGWNTDPYTNWLTQNSINIMGNKIDPNTMGTIGNIGSMAIGGVLLATGVGAIAGGVMIAGGAVGMLEQAQANYEHDMIPEQARGNTNVGDYSYAFGLTNFEFKRMSIKEEYARVIDAYFTRFGYKVNSLKLPNQTGRTNYNYVQISKGEILAYQKDNVTAIPPQDLIKINALYQRGITLWHNYTNFGDFSVANGIVSQNN